MLALIAVKLTDSNQCPKCGSVEVTVKQEGMYKVVVCSQCGTVRKQIECEDWF